jgi:hypothetical protein
VEFEIEIINVKGTGLSRRVTARVKNTGSANVHNTWAKAEVFCRSQGIRVSGQDYLKRELGTMKAHDTVTIEETFDFGLFDGLTIMQNGAQVLLTVFSDESTQTLNYDYKP